MRIFFISPIRYESPGLYSSFVKTFTDQGHEIVNDISKATCVFFDLHSGFAPYDDKILTWVLINSIPICVLDCHDYHQNSTDNWYWHEKNYEKKKYGEMPDWWRFVFDARAVSIPIIYFMRKIQTNNNFPKWIYPFEYTYYSDHNFQPVSKEEFISRRDDVCFIGAASTKRATLIADLLKYKAVHVNYKFTTERIPHEDWLNEHRKAKMYLEASGGGLGSERPYQLTTVSAQLRERTNQLQVHPWTDMVNCLLIGDREGNINETDINKLLSVLENGDKLYDIYRNGIYFLHQYYSEESRALYILDILRQNNIF